MKNNEFDISANICIMKKVLCVFWASSVLKQQVGLWCILRSRTIQLFSFHVRWFDDNSDTNVSVVSVTYNLVSDLEGDHAQQQEGREEGVEENKV